MPTRKGLLSLSVATHVIDSAWKSASFQIASCHSLLLERCSLVLTRTYKARLYIRLYITPHLSPQAPLPPTTCHTW